MSTKVTKKSTSMVDSQSLKLVFASSKVNELITKHVSDSLRKQGYKSATASTLSFLSALDCGVNYGSEIARNLRVSRQMVAKTVKELCAAGYLIQVDGTGKQKQILYTDLGEKLIDESRRVLSQLDSSLSKEMGKVSLSETISRLERVSSYLVELVKDGT
ncbi:MAG: winged helix-turn-helix transcriptional regulator [Gammaproteobacteria bacterium]|nr:winged helix-turn-helix transcriptional regulator [Gammaproteobacteria bacterium]